MESLQSMVSECDMPQHGCLAAARKGVSGVQSHACWCCSAVACMDVSCLHYFAGVLAFTAAEGTIGMPPQVARNVFGVGAVAPPDNATVDVLYRKLPKGAPLYGPAAILQKTPAARHVICHGSSSIQLDVCTDLASTACAMSGV